MHPRLSILVNNVTNYSLYNLLGAQPEMHQKLKGIVFRAWGPAASNIAVTGHFNGWDCTETILNKTICLIGAIYDTG